MMRTATPARTPPVLRPFLHACAALLLAGVPLQAQEPGLACGDRAPGKYAVVLDASSSLTHSGRLARQTEESYVDVLERVAGLLCRDEKLMVYPLVRDDATGLVAVDSVLPGEASPARLRTAVRTALSRDPGHSDLLLGVNRTREDVLSRPEVRAVLYLTDGSFYPRSVPSRDRRLQEVMDRLTELDQVVMRLRRDGLPFYVVGIGADQAPAVDPDLAFTWPDSAGRAWEHGAGSLDLKRTSGDGLLSEIFGPAYVPQQRLNVWTLLIGDPASPWQSTLGYLSGWTRALSELRAVRMEHLVFVPTGGGGPASCARVRWGPRAGGAPPPVQAIRIAPHLYACSLQGPTPVEIDSVAAHGVNAFVFSQPPRFFPAKDPAPLYGLHELILSLDSTPCPEWTLSRDALHGRRPGGDAVGLLEVVPLAGVRGVDTVSMVRQHASPCIVTNVGVDTAGAREGDYLLFLSDTLGEWVQKRQFAAPRLELAAVDYRPGGFPFPPGRLVLLGVCVNSTERMRPGEKLVVEFDTAVRELDRAVRGDCPHPATGVRRPYVYGFRGVILLESTDVAGARVGIASAGRAGSMPARGGWLPVPLAPNGTWFLSRACLYGSAALGVLMQIGYLVICAGMRLRDLRNMRRLLSAALSVFISGMLVVVFTELCVMVNESPLHASSIPIPFGLLVFGHAVKLLAAALVPELVEDALLSD